MNFAIINPIPDLLFLFCHLVEKEWGNMETVHYVFISFKAAYNLDRS
jgi:hypothetical protein